MAARRAGEGIKEYLMSDPISRPDGGYTFLEGGENPFSLGVACLPGHALTRVRFRKPPPLAEGLARAAAHIRAQGRPLAAIAACELRSPAQMSSADFTAFNQDYVEMLRANGFPAEPPFPLARSNVAVYIDPPPAHTLFAFTYTIAASGATSARDYLISGMPDSIKGPVRTRVADGDSSPAGTEKKAIHVFDGLRERVRELGVAWSDITGVQSYTARAIEPVVKLLSRYGLSHVGLTAHPALPPVQLSEFEADVRAVSVEKVI
jgi:hypothetical protein